MPLHVPGSLDRLLSLLGPCFSQPAFQTFRALVVGFIARVGEHTVTGMWQAVRLAGRVHHCHAHDFFARRRWDPDRLGLALLEFLVTVFVKAGAPIRLAIDDTLFGRSGRRVFGAHYLHDGCQPAGQGRRTRWGNCFVVVGLVVALPCLGGRSVCLPVLFRLFRPREDAHPDRPSQPELARPPGAEGQQASLAGQARPDAPVHTDHGLLARWPSPHRARRRDHLPVVRPLPHPPGQAAAGARIRARRWL